MEIKNTKDLSEDELFQATSPFSNFKAALRKEGEFYTYTDVCKMLSVSRPTITKVTHGKGTDAPSKVVLWGKRHVWVFTHQDVVDVADALGLEEIEWPS